MVYKNSDNNQRSFKVIKIMNEKGFVNGKKKEMKKRKPKKVKENGKDYLTALR